MVLLWVQRVGESHSQNHCQWICSRDRHSGYHLQKLRQKHLIPSSDMRRGEKLQRSDTIHQFTTTDALSRGNAPRDMLRPGMQNSLVEMLNVARYHPEHGETRPQPTAFRRIPRPTHESRRCHQKMHGTMDTSR